MSAIGLSVLLLLLGSAPSAAQTELVVSDELACPRCEIVLDSVATLGALEEEVALSRESGFAVDPDRRRIYAAQTYLPGAVVMYDWNGELVSTFGGPGQGPGEFGGPVLGFRLRLDGVGRLHVIQAGRRSIIEPELAGLVDTHPVTESFDGVAVLGDGRLVGAASALRRVPGRERFAVLDPTGEELGRFVPMPPDPVPVAPTPARGGGFWAAYFYEYRVEEYGPEGDLRRVVRREAEWFSPYPTADSGPPFSKPRFTTLYQDDQGRLWTGIWVPAADHARAETALAETLRFDQLDMHAVRDTRIEVIDLESGRLLASRLLDRSVTLLDSGHVVELRETPEGLIQAVVFSLSLATPDRDP